MILFKKHVLLVDPMMYPELDFMSENDPFALISQNKF
jgi:hypothetical protein